MKNFVRTAAAAIIVLLAATALATPSQAVRGALDFSTALDLFGARAASSGAVVKGVLNYGKPYSVTITDTKLVGRSADSVRVCTYSSETCVERKSGTSTDVSVGDDTSKLFSIMAIVNGITGPYTAGGGMTTQRGNTMVYTQPGVGIVLTPTTLTVTEKGKRVARLVIKQ